MIRLEAEHYADIAAHTGGVPQAIAIVFERLRQDPDSVSMEHLAALPGIRRFVHRLLLSLPDETQHLLRLLVLRSNQVATISLDLLPQLDLLERQGLTSTTATQSITIHPLLHNFITYYGRKE